MSTVQQELRSVRHVDGMAEHEVAGLVDHSMMRAIYVYEAPVRLWHWVTAVAVFVLIVTGFLIGRPLPSMQGEASDWYMMGYVRLAHFIAAYVFAIGFVGRLYWHFVGNRWNRQLFTPKILLRKFWADLVHQIGFYLFLTKESRKYVAHDPLANLAMSVMYGVLGLWMIVSGFTLYSEGAGRDSWAYAVFGWVTIVFPNSMDLHTFHRYGMYAMLVFTMVHIYMVFREDVYTRQSILSTMVNGYRYFKD
jgi:Ni/Fe-hydrogenase 1 B-type cytochrome subunit